MLVPMQRNGPQSAMQFDDVFRRRLSKAAAELSAWARDAAGATDVAIVNTARYFKIDSRPKTPGAAAFELLIRADQFYDIAIAGEVYEDRAIDDAELFLPLVVAISEGHLSRRVTSSALTGTLQAIETIVDLDSRPQWSAKHVLVSGLALAPDDATEIETRRFLPYRR
jgi:hypothetical protein